MKRSKANVISLLALFVGGSFPACRRQADPVEPEVRLEVQLISQESGLSGSLRGLSAVNSHVAWVSGADGSFARTWDGGQQWHPGTVSGAEQLDFRDLEAWDAENAILMSAGPGDGSRIYATRDGGRNWTLLYTNPHAEGFFDGMAFSSPQKGFLYGDAIEGKLFVIKTEDGGVTWSRIDPLRLPALLEEEHGFAASGTGIAVAENQVWIATGGVQARVFHSSDGGLTWTVTETPVSSGDAASGIFSIAVNENLDVVAVGGSYQEPAKSGKNLAISRNPGSWTLIEATPPFGYKSVISFLPGTGGQGLLVSGTSGSHYSTGGGNEWLEIEPVGYHTVGFGTSLDSGWAAGAGGRVAKVVVLR